MSRAAQAVEKAVREMREAAAKERRKAQREVQTVADDDQEIDPASELEDLGEFMDAPEDGEGPETPVAPTGKSKRKTAGDTMAKKKTGARKGAAKAATTKAKTAKAPRAAKGERRPREKKVASGAIKNVVAMGGTYLALEFDEGKIVLSPTSNREQNRDIAVKALKAALKG